jgi:FkbM family methyltransferase
MLENNVRNEICQMAHNAVDVDPKKILHDLFSAHQHLIVYGAGNAGRRFNTFVKEIIPNKKVDFYLDKNAANIKELMGCRVYEPSSTAIDVHIKKNALVVLAVVMDSVELDLLCKKLQELGYPNIINGLSISPLAVESDFIAESLERNIYVNNLDSILSVYDMLEDEHSRFVYHAILKLYALQQYNNDILSPNMVQYTNVQVPFRNSYKYFVDCGAHTGSTLKPLVERHKVHTYIAFEPDTDNYIKLIDTAAKLKESYHKAILLPLGVGDKNEILSFDALGSGCSRINPLGSTTIQTVKLDDTLCGYDNLMIKMDIEGAEKDALNGARNIITNTKPDLAICVYHRISDLWEFALTIKKWVPEYRLYLRNHYYGATETVLYATVGQDG